MEEKIKARIAEVELAEREAEMRLTVIKTLLAELRALIQPEPTIAIEPAGT